MGNLLIGSYKAKLDNGGRIKIPEKFRTAIEEKYGKGLFITSLQDDFVQIFPLPVWERMTETPDNGTRYPDPDIQDFLRKAHLQGSAGRDRLQGPGPDRAPAAGKIGPSIRGPGHRLEQLSRGLGPGPARRGDEPEAPDPRGFQDRLPADVREEARMNDRGHVPVLLEEALEYLDAGRPGTYIDGTLGMAGHSAEILKRNPKARLIGFDLDESTLLRARDYLQAYANRVELYYADFKFLPDMKLDLSDVRGVLLDLGMSSVQLDSPERGFSHTLDGPLDMRMDARNKLTAAKILEKYTEARLAHVFRVYGELKPSAKLARTIATIRRSQKIESTLQLRAIVEQVCHWIPQKGKVHPASKVFQALRIEVNQELAGLEEFLERIIRSVGPGTRFVVDLLPFARGPHRQAYLPAPRPSGERARPDRHPDQEARPAGRGRSRPELPVPLGQASRRGEENPWSGVSSAGRTSSSASAAASSPSPS